MSLPEYDPKRLTATRSALIDIVARANRRRLPVWAAIAVFTAGGVLTGGAVSAAALGFRPTMSASPFTIGSPEGLRGVPALPGTQPGTPIVSLLGGGTSVTIGDDRSIGLSAPTTATDVRVTATCIEPGSVTFGTDSSGNNPGGTCSVADIGTPTTYDDFPLTTSTDKLFLNATGRWVVSFQFLRKVQTAWAVNAHGQTYGVEKPGEGSPTLLAVQGVTDGGKEIDGYAFADQLSGPQPTSPSDAATFNDKIKQQYPNGIPVPVYKSDGETRIGTFYIGGK